MGNIKGDFFVRKEIVKYSAIIIIVMLFGLFVYPTMYQYDKLEQKFPVKINRITGESKVLTKQGWEDPGSYNAAASEMKKYRDEIITEINSNRELVKQQVISELRDEIVSEVKNDIAATKIEIEKYKQHELDPTTYFTVGDSKETVKKIMGVPDAINEYSWSDDWRYEQSYVTFKNGKVSEWNDYGGVLRVK